MQGENKLLVRYLEHDLKRLIKKYYSCLILGPRQAGKTTLVNSLIGNVPNVASYLLQDPSVRLRFEQDPAALLREVRALDKKPYVFIDEAQKVPDLFDGAQVLIDNKEAAFILTGSSARKLRRHSVNLLPGRLKLFHIFPLSWGELGLIKECAIGELAINNINPFFGYTFEDSMVFGSLPGIVTLPREDKEDFLRAYSETYLEEEIRAEAISRKIGAFARFLELAAAESGTAPNFSKISGQSGVSQPAVKEFYKILEDTMIVERVEPYLKSARKRIFTSNRYYFFDIGVRNCLARLPLARELVNAQKGELFEHAVMLEIIKRVKIFNKNFKVCYWRTRAGAEVDCIIDMGRQVIPIEIKSSAKVSLSELKGLVSFLDDYKNAAGHGYVVTLGERKERLAENITAIPWNCL